MKQIKIYFWVLFSTLMCIACSDDLGLNTSDLQDVREGIPVEIKMNFNVEKSGKVEVSRATDQEDGLIYDLFVLIFDSQKKLKTVFYEDFLTDLSSERNLKIRTTSGESYIFAVANVNKGVPAEYNVTALAEKLNSLRSKVDEYFTIDDLKALTIKLSEKNADIINRTQSRYVMSGKFSPDSGTDNGDGFCVIPETNTTLSGKVHLYRTDAKITFNLYVNGTRGVFTPKTYRIANIPLCARAINEQEDWDGSESTSGSADNYYTISENDAINVVTEGIDENQNEYRTFTFYMPENRKASKGNVSSYHEREKQEKTETAAGSVQNGDWEYAPDYGTYVILSGHFVGTDEKGNSVDANVQYKIHLGNFTEDFSNFETSRNTSYTYKVHVNGVDKIVVEVDTGKEEQPGATGDVYYTTETNLYTLDAHFEKCLMVFSYDQLASYKEKGQIDYLVNTPFTELGADKASDAAWVQFRVNEKSNGVYKDDLQPYHPDQVMNITEFINTLTELADKQSDSDWDNNKEYKVTCFVNEYYYSNDNSEQGWISQYATPVNIAANVPAWKYAANQPNRKLMILCDIRSSADGESSIIDAAYVLSQRSIQTFYNTDPSVTGLKSALGLETVNETGPLAMGDPRTKPDDLRDGLTNTLDMWGISRYSSPQWSTYINSSNNGYLDPKSQGSGYNGLTDRYNAAYIACLQRNRDENGNGTIDEDEVKWYMPALNQYAAFFVGAEALSQESRFYTSSIWELIHYYSSTYGMRDNKTDVMTVWAEEGFSYSTESQADGWYNTGNGTHSGIGNRHYRCVRNVGNINGNSAGDKRPQNYWYKDGNIIRFNYLAPAALRQVPVTSGELSNRHTERSNQNRIYSAFAIASRDASSTCSGSAARGNTTVCSSYYESGASSGKWRVPNHRELLFMTLNGLNGTGVLTNFPQKDKNSYRGYHCRTLFTWSYVFDKTYKSPLDGKARYGYRIESNGNMSITEGDGDKLYVRCVRDIIE